MIEYECSSGAPLAVAAPPPYTSPDLTGSTADVCAATHTVHLHDNPKVRSQVANTLMLMAWSPSGLAIASKDTLCFSFTDLLLSPAGSAQNRAKRSLPPPSGAIR